MQRKLRQKTKWVALVLGTGALALGLWVATPGETPLAQTSGDVQGGYWDQRPAPPGTNGTEDPDSKPVIVVK